MSAIEVLPPIGAWTEDERCKADGAGYPRTSFMGVLASGEVVYRTPWCLLRKDHQGPHDYGAGQRLLWDDWGK